MSLRREVHSAFDVIAPPLEGMPERMVQTVLAEHKARRRKEKMLFRLRAPLSLVAVFLFIALIAAIFVGGRVVQDWNAFHKPVPAGPPHSALAELEGRPLHLPSLHSILDCNDGPKNSEGSYGSGPIYGDGGGQTTTNKEIYFHNSLYADKAIDGPILVRVRDLFTHQTIVFVGDFAAGPVVDTDTVDGKLVQQHAELVVYTDAQAHAPHLIASTHPYAWLFTAGAPQSWSSSTGWQIDGLGFSEVFVVC